MFLQELVFHLMLDLMVVVVLNIVYGRVWQRSYRKPVEGRWVSPFLPPDLTNFLIEMKKTFQETFPEADPINPGPGRPRLKRLPLFLSWVWNRMYYQRDTAKLLQTVNTDPQLRQMFELPPSGLKSTTYEDFTKYELLSYLESLIPKNIQALHRQQLSKLVVLALDDHPVESPLNMSKAIDFVEPRLEAIQKIFKTLPPLIEMNILIGTPPNSQRSWSDYLKLYLLFLLWGFPSQKCFDGFIRAQPQLRTVLQLERKVVLSATLFPYIRILEEHSRASKIFQTLLQILLSVPAVKTRQAKSLPLTEVRMLRGILGNSHSLKDYGAALHYNSSKGKYYFGRVGRILVDTWSQIPLWGWVYTASQPLARDLKTFGHKALLTLPAFVKPLLLLADQGFRGTEQLAALRHGFARIQTVLLTPAYKRNRPRPNLFRIERLAVERTIGHLEVHLDFEHPRQLGEKAALSWVLGTIFLMQGIALYNHKYHPQRSPIAITHLKR